jgi:hypothetical protein
LLLSKESRFWPLVREEKSSRSATKKRSGILYVIIVGGYETKIAYFLNNPQETSR